MIGVLFRAEARADLKLISDYYSDVSKTAADNVQCDIQDTIETLRLFPKVGRQIGRNEHRRIVTPKYRYVIVYKPTRDAIHVIGIFRNKNR